MGYRRLGRLRKPMERSALQAKRRRHQLCIEETEEEEALRAVGEVREPFLVSGTLPCLQRHMIGSYLSNFRSSAIPSEGIPDLAKLNFSSFASHLLPTILIYFFRALIITKIFLFSFVFAYCVLLPFRRKAA